jgi:hypothetical protein
MALQPDILNEPCDLIAHWSNGDQGTAVSQVDPVGQWNFDTGASAANNDFARRNTITGITPPNQFTIEFKVKCENLGTRTNQDFLRFLWQTATWKFVVSICSDGLYITKVGNAITEVGTDIVKCNGGAAWQIFRFQVDKSAGESLAVVETFLEGVSQGTVDCDYETSQNDKIYNIYLYGYTTNNIHCHIDYIKIATGLGEIGNYEGPAMTKDYLEYHRGRNRFRTRGVSLGIDK